MANGVNRKKLASFIARRKINALGLQSLPAAIISVGSAIKYLKNVQKNDLDNIRDINYYSDSQYMKIGYSTKRDLEIVETIVTVIDFLSTGEPTLSFPDITFFLHRFYDSDPFRQSIPAPKSVPSADGTAQNPPDERQTTD